MTSEQSSYHQRVPFSVLEHMNSVDYEESARIRESPIRSRVRRWCTFVITFASMHLGVHFLLPYLYQTFKESIAFTDIKLFAKSNTNAALYISALLLNMILLLF